MVRALLRADQMRDADNLTELEHDVLVHENLVTSGTLNFQDGTISGTGDVYATTFYGDGSNLTGIDTEPESLYLSGEAKATAHATGIRITDGTYTSSLEQVDSLLKLENENTSGWIRLTSHDSTTAEVNVFRGSPDGAAYMYHSGDSRLVTASNGVSIWDNSAGSLSIYGGGSSFILSATRDDDLVIIRSNNSASEDTNLLRGDPNGTVELYYAGVKAVETHSQGIVVHRDDASATLSIKFDASGNMVIDNDTGNNITLQANGKNLFNAWGNGVASIYYGGELRLATYSQGVIIHRADKHSRIVHSVDGDLVVQADEPGRTLLLRGTTTASGNAAKTMFIGDPDGAAEIYYAGDKVLETTATSGINITNEVTAVTYYGDGSNLTGITHPSTTLSGVVQGETYETVTSTATDTITLDFNHDNYGVVYVDGVRQQADAFSYSGTNQLVLDEVVPSGTAIAFSHLISDEVDVAVLSNTYEETLTSGTDTITLDFAHGNVGTAYLDGLRQKSSAFSFSGTNQIVFVETLPADTEVVFTNITAEESQTYYTQDEVDDLIAGLQSQIDALLAL